MLIRSIIIQNLQHVAIGWSWPCTAVHGQATRNDCVSEIWRRSLNQILDLGFRFVSKRLIICLILRETKLSERKRITPNSSLYRTVLAIQFHNNWWWSARYVIYCRHQPHHVQCPAGPLHMMWLMTTQHKIHTTTSSYNPSIHVPVLFVVNNNLSQQRDCIHYHFFWVSRLYKTQNLTYRTNLISFKH